MVTPVLKYLLTSLLLLTPLTAMSLECANSRCYTDTYKSVDAESLATLNRVTKVYTRLTKTIGSRKVKHSKLLVITSNGHPWAVALSDNTVVITSGAVKKMYQENDFELGDARAAFVLGHELSHLETEDLFHHRAFIANTKSIQKLLPSKPELDEELRADLRGFTYATIAGYRTDRLLTKESDFFKDWLASFSTNGDSTHPSHTARSQYLRQGFKNILRDAPYYDYATALAHFGRYQDAQHLLEDFINSVETREAYSNLGYVHLQQAREHMPINMAYRYWFPTLLEPASGLKIPRERGLFDQELPARSLHHLERAEQYLQRAISMDDTQLTSYINLAAVYLYMPDKVHRAYAAIEDALRTPLGSIPTVQNQLESVYQIIRTQDNYDNADRWPQARDRMARLANKDPVADNLLYNFARMLDERGRDDTATQYWQRLYEHLDDLPLAYRAQVCHRLRKEQCAGQSKRAFPKGDINIPLDMDIRYPEMKRHIQSHWNFDSTPAKLLPGLNAQIFFNKYGDSLLALDNHMEMMILRNIPARFQSIAALQAEFGDPVVSLPAQDGQVMSFSEGWSAVIRNSEVKEIWLSELTNTSQNSRIDP